jgi:choline dehydrogenase-like flavoprotein
MDHATSLAAAATIPGFESRTYHGNRPTGVVIPRFLNLDNAGERGFTRGYGFQGGAYRAGWTRGFRQAGLGMALKSQLRSTGDWKFVLTTFAECLPRADNRITLDADRTDSLGAPQLRIEFEHGENERKLLADAKREAAAMIEAAGGSVQFGSDVPNPGGSAIHEMGGARMGNDPSSSVLNAHNQAHDVSNLFVTDGACMASSACQNPSLTYMALTARAAEFAVVNLKAGRL